MEFLYNNSLNTINGVSPFFANKSYYLNISVYLEQDLIFEWACEYSINPDSLYQFLYKEMAAAQLWYQGPADIRWTLTSDFKIGDQAFIKVKYFYTTRLSRKLIERNLGPFTIITQPGTHSITLQLLDSMKSVHPVFHVSWLEPVMLGPG